MRSAHSLSQQRFQRQALGLTGASLLAGAALAGAFAAAHMAMLNSLCGTQGAPHCAACFAAAAFAAAGLATLATALVPAHADTAKATRRPR